MEVCPNGGSPNWGRSNGGSPNWGTPTICSDWVLNKQLFSFKNNVQILTASVGSGLSVEYHLKNSFLRPLATTDMTWHEGLGVFFGLWPRPTRLDLRVGWVWYWCLRSVIKYWDPRSEVQTVRPQVCSSNTKTPGLKFKQWHPRSGAWMLRTQVCSLNTESPGLQLMKCRPGLSVFEPQTLVLSIWAPDLGSHCLNFRPGVSLFELQTRGLTVWTTDLGSQYLITDLRSQYLTCRPGYRSR